MNVTELARKLKIPTKELLEILPVVGFGIGRRAIKINEVAANRIINNWPQLLKEYQKLQTKEVEIIKTPVAEIKKTVKIPSFITVRDFAAKIQMPITKVLAELMKNGILLSMNEKIDFETAAVIGTDLGLEITPLTQTETELTEIKLPALSTQDKSKLVPRPPVVVVLGHVDHGKTKLLDTIRKTNVAGGEAGGITQHIGAYQISKKGRLLTFIDTPGHEAFSMMRSRGARIADIAILVIAADDGIQPQTDESIKIIKSAKLPMIVAINKIDKPEANPDKIKQELAQRDLTSEEWGGKTICLPISAKTGQGVDELLETLILVADLNKENILADPEGEVSGTVVESHIDKGEGPVATVLVQNGALKKGGQLFLNNFYYGKVKALKNFLGQLIEKATPSMPVKILGLKGVPAVGDIIKVKQRVSRDQKLKHYQLKSQAAAAYTSIVNPKEEGKEKKSGVNLIIKTDVLGSLEAIIASLDKLTHPDVDLEIISKGLGNINESEVMLAEANQALVLGFHVNLTPIAAGLAAEKKVEVKIYKIIYELLDEVKKRLEALIKPEIIKTNLGRLKVLAVFRKERGGQIIGGQVTKGKVLPNAKVEVIRNEEVIAKGNVIQLQVNKVNVDEATLGQECGLKYEGKPVIQEGDFLEVYQEEVKKKTINF